MKYVNLSATIGGIDGVCTHEVACHTGSITIVCRDLTATWVEADCPDKPPKTDPERG